MNSITIQVHYELFGSEGLRRGSFKVNSRMFAQYPDLEASRVAKNLIKEIQRESGYHTKIVQVLYADNIDITNLALAPDKTNEPDLPF